ncbi:hypothetical protein STENM327S_07529 [Streptomyces tendae]
MLALARAADRAEAQAVLLPDMALHTAAHIPALEKDLGKPVLTANEVDRGRACGWSTAGSTHRSWARC